MRHSSILSFAIASAALLCPSPSVAKASTIPFELRDGHIFVQAYVNGKGPFLFGFDTGASGDGRSDVRLTSQLKLPKVGDIQNSDGIETVTTDVVKADRLRLGPIEKRNVRLLSRNYNGSSTSPPFLMGIIGRDFFAGWLLTINYRKKTLLFSRGQLKARDKGVVAYGPGIRVPLCIERQCVDAKIDTGSSGTVIIPKTMALANAVGQPKLLGTGKRTNSVTEVYQIELKAPIRIAGVLTTDRIVTYADRSEDVANVGTNFLKDYLLTIDERHRLLLLRPVPRD